MLTTEHRAALDHVSEAARRAVRDGLYETAIGCLDARTGEPQFIAFTHGYWRMIPVSREDKPA